MSALAFSILVAATLAMAILSDKVGRLPLMRLGGLIMLFLMSVAIGLLIGGHVNSLTALLPLLLSPTMIMGVYEAGMIELFPTELRYSGVSMCHNLAFCLFGGLTPLLLEWFCANGLLAIIGIWPALISVALLALTYQWKDRFQEKLAQI